MEFLLSDDINELSKEVVVGLDDRFNLPLTNGWVARESVDGDMTTDVFTSSLFSPLITSPTRFSADLDRPAMLGQAQLTPALMHLLMQVVDSPTEPASHQFKLGQGKSSQLKCLPVLECVAVNAAEIISRMNRLVHSYTSLMLRLLPAV